MANTFELIASYTATGSVASIDFTSIPSTYTDLVLKISARGAQADVSHALTIRFNSATSNYSSKELVGSGSSVGTASRTNLGSAMYVGNIDGSSATSNTFSNTEIYIPNYAGSSYKSVSVDNVSENNGTEAYATLLAGLWSDTSAITSVSIVPLAAHGNLVQYTTAYLYGVKNS
jgi:hypothetical protein